MTINRKPTKWLLLLLALFILLGKTPLLLAEHLDSLTTPDQHTTLSNCHSAQDDLAADSDPTLDDCNLACPLCNLSSHLMEPRPKRAYPVTAHLIPDTPPYSVQEHHPPVEHGPPRYNAS